MRIVCSSNMPFAREAFSTLGEVVMRDGRAICAQDVADAEILATRSTTKVDRALLEGSRVRFAGTATIGTDHMDLPYLERRGIRWCAAPGCNANSVSEYLTAALLCLAEQHGFRLEGKTIGVIGVGNVGTRVVGKALALGMQVLPNDPPRQRALGQPSVIGHQSSVNAETRADGGGMGARINHQPLTINHFLDLDRVLAESDIVTLHVPLTREGEDATYQMADAAFFSRMKRGAIFVNAARGAVVDTNALLAAMADGAVSHAVIDTWEGEPDYRADLLDRVDLGTPHIAGHSFEGKYIGTLMVYREVCDFLGVEPAWTPDALLPAPPVPELTVDALGKDDEQVLREIVKQVYDIEAEDARLREGGADRAAHFDGLRKNYPMRREFRFTTVHAANASPSLKVKIGGLGFAG